LQSKAKGEKARRRLGHGMRIKSQTKEVIVDVYNYFELMKKKILRCQAHVLQKEPQKL
jgi:hypothetical protein